MATGHITQLRRLQARNDHDVIVIRQEVRQVARALGMGLAEQAKIAAAISTVARLLLAQCPSAQFTIRTAEDRTRTALEVVCEPECGAGVTPAELEQALQLDRTHLLVDEVDLAQRGGTVALTLRMRLASQPRQ